MKKRISIIIPTRAGDRIYALQSIKDKRIKVIIERGDNTSRNRNRGTKKARTELIAFINSHTLIEKSWTKEVLKFFDRNKKIDIVGGPQLTPKDDSFFSKATGHALASKFGGWETSNRYSQKKELLDADETSLTSANLICRNKVLKKVKFDENLYPGEDPKFIQDSKKRGFRVAYTPKIIVYNKRRTNISALIKQIFSYGKLRPEKEKLYETLKRPFFLIPSLFLIYLLVLPFFLFISKLFAIPLLLYLLLNLLYSFFISRKSKGILYFFVIPFIFLAVHLSYGAGFVYGMICKLNKEGKK